LFGKTTEVPEQTSGNELHEINNNIPGCSDCGFEEVTKWTKSDADEHGFQILTDQKIIDNIREEDNSEGEEDKEENYEQIPSHSEAFNCLKIALKWYEKQSECNAAQLLMLKCL
jgi:hypothetical protein